MLVEWRYAQCSLNLQTGRHGTQLTHNTDGDTDYSRVQYSRNG